MVEGGTAHGSEINDQLLSLGVVGDVVISKKILRTRRIMVMHSNERGECVHVPS